MRSYDLRFQLFRCEAVMTLEIRVDDQALQSPSDLPGIEQVSDNPPKIYSL